MRISAATTAFLRDRMRRGCNTLTLTYYRSQMSVFADWLAGCDVQELREVDAGCVSGYVSELQARAGQGSRRRLSGVTVRKRVMALKTFFRWAVSANALDADPCKDVVTPRSPQRLPKALSLAQARLLLCSSMDLRTRAAIALMLDTGIRIAECCALDLADVDMIERTIRIRMGKGSKQRMVVFESVTHEVLCAWLTLRATQPLRDPNALFITVVGSRLSKSVMYKDIKRAARDVGLGDVVSPHRLRHTFATLYLDNGGSIQDASELLGHSHIGTTMIYTHISRAGLRRKHAAYSPLNALSEEQ